MVPQNTSGYQISYTSSDSGIAAVSPSGKITAVADGTAVIRVVLTQIDGTQLIEEIFVFAGSQEEPAQTVKKPAKVKGLKVKAISGGKIRVTWNKVKNADGYEIYRANKKNGTYKKAAAVTKGLKKDFKVKKGKAAGYFKVRAYKKANGTKLHGAFSAKVKG